MSKSWVTLKTFHLIRGVILAALAGSLSAQPTAIDAEKAAVSYMAAFFRNDLEVAAEYLGPQILEPFKDAVVVRFDASDQAVKNEFLLKTQYRSADDLKGAPAKELFVRVLRWERSKTPNFIEKAKSAKVAVEKCEALPHGKFRVSLIISIAQLPDEAATVLVQKIDAKWVVIGI